MSEITTIEAKIKARDTIEKDLDITIPNEQLVNCSIGISNPLPPSLIFNDRNGEHIGKLYWSDRKLVFEGNAEESAAVLLDYVCKSSIEYIEHLIKIAVDQDRIHRNDELDEIPLNMANRLFELNNGN